MAEEHGDNLIKNLRRDGFDEKSITQNACRTITPPLPQNGIHSEVGRIPVAPEKGKAPSAKLGAFRRKREVTSVVKNQLQNLVRMQAHVVVELQFIRGFCAIVRIDPVSPSVVAIINDEVNFLFSFSVVLIRN